MSVVPIRPLGALLLCWAWALSVDAADVRMSPPDGVWQAFASHIDLQRDDNGAQLTLVLDNKFKPRPGVPAWPLVPPIAWNADPFGDPNWRFQLHAWRMLDPLVRAYLRDPRPELLDHMLVVAADWKRHHLDQGQVSEFANYDMALGLRAQRLAWLWLALGDAGRIEERDAIIAPLTRAAMEALLAQRPFSDNNHGLFQVHGLLALCKAGVAPARCTEAQPAALAGFERLLAQQFGTDFAHVEHSPAYHFFALRTFGKMRASGWYDDATTATAILDGATAVAPWLVDPSGKLYPVGDSDSAKGTMRVPGDRQCVLQSAATCYVLKTFSETGWAVARSDWGTEASQGSALFFQAAHHSSTHKHADDLSFTWFDRGRDVLIDPGRYGYVDAPMRDYMISTRAHNAVEIGGRSQHTGSDGDTRLLGTGVEGDAFVLAGHATHARTATRQHRSLVYQPQRALIVIDRLASPTPQASTHWFQFARDARLLPAGDDAPDERMVALDGGLMRVLIARPDCTIDGYRGEPSPRLQGWATTGYAEAAPTLSLAVRCGGAATAATVGVAFVWQDADPNPVRREMQRRMQGRPPVEPRT